MARAPKKAASTETLDSVNTAQIEKDRALHGQLVTERDRILADVDARFGLDQPYELEVYINAARDAVAVVGERLFVIGRACIAIKEHEAHGTFTEALERIGIAPRFARKCMAAALKFEGSDARKLVAARLSSSKLLELMAEDDEELDNLVDGGTLAGHSLDDIERMPIRQLRETLRTERKAHADEIGAHEEIVKRKDEKIHQLDLERRRFKKLPFQEQVDSALIEFGSIAVAALGACNQVRDAMRLFEQMYEDAGERMTPEVQEAIEGHARALVSAVETITRLAHV